MLAKANVLGDLKQESWTVIERRNDQPFLRNANANGLNYSTKKQQSLHPTKNLHDALIIDFVVKEYREKTAIFCLPLVASL